MKFEGGGSPGAAESNSNHVNSIFLSQPCMSYIISHTSPRDACRASLVSSLLNVLLILTLFGAVSCPLIISTYSLVRVSPVKLFSKKQLYFRLCDSPLLLDDGNLSFYLYKQNGKKCFMLGAKALSIAWSNTVFWRWRSSPESRFSEVAELLAVCWLEIVGKFKTSMLSSNTRYVAYLVVQHWTTIARLDFPATTSVRHIDDTTDDDDDDFATTVVYLKPPPNASDRTTGGVPQKRADGWMEIELGKFYNDRTESEVDIRFTETRELHWKAGLIIEGMIFVLRAANDT